MPHHPPSNTLAAPVSRPITNGADLRAARLALGLASDELATALGYNWERGAAQRVVGSWERGERAIPAYVALLVECFVAGARPHTWPTRARDSELA